MPRPSPQSYLLHLRRDRPSGRWHVSLQDLKSGERIGFADMDRLFAYLRRMTKDAPDERGTLTATER